MWSVNYVPLCVVKIRCGCTHVFHETLPGVLRLTYIVFGPDDWNDKLSSLWSHFTSNSSRCRTYEPSACQIAFPPLVEQKHAQESVSSMVKYELKLSLRVFAFRSLSSVVDKGFWQNPTWRPWSLKAIAKYWWTPVTPSLWRFSMMVVVRFG